MDVELVVTETAEAAAAAAAERLASFARAGGHVALAGGSTPQRAYELAAAAAPDWSRCEIWLGDERCVPLDDERSNARLVREALVDRLAAGPGASHWVRTDLPAEEAADAYESELRGAAPLGLALLGLGADGHTASLFSGAPALDECERLAIAVAPGLAPWVERVTMTITGLSTAAEVVFLAVGGEKAEAARLAFGESPSRETPASLVRSGSGTTTAVLDSAAAARLQAR